MSEHRRGDRGGADLHAAHPDEFVRLHAGREGQISIEGPAIEVGAHAISMLHMSFHELATNAAKYGALSVPSGSMRVTWERVSDGRGEAV